MEKQDGPFISGQLITVVDLAVNGFWVFLPAGLNRCVARFQITYALLEGDKVVGDKWEIDGAGYKDWDLIQKIHATPCECKVEASGDMVSPLRCSGPSWAPCRGAVGLLGPNNSCDLLWVNPDWSVATPEDVEQQELFGKIPPAADDPWLLCNQIEAMGHP